MPRPQLRDALGREAVYQRPPSGKPSEQPQDNTTGEAVRGARKPRWDELNVRATYHLPRDLVDAVTSEAERSGRSKAQVVSEALRQHLKAPR